MAYIKKFLAKNEKGQLSIEFILILAVVLILLQIMIIPMRDTAESTLNSLTSVSYLDADITKISSAVKNLGTMSEGRLFVEVYVPEDATLLITNNKIRFDIIVDFNTTSLGYAGCEELNCHKEMNFAIQTSNTETQTLNGPAKYLITVEKNPDLIILSDKIGEN